MKRLALLTLLGTACGGSNSGQGTVGGNPVILTNALAFQGSVNTMLFLTSFGSGCSSAEDLAHGIAKANGEILLVQLPAQVPAGAYSMALDSGSDTGALYVATDATCQGAQESSSGGSVTITRSDATGVDGTFDVLLGSRAGRLTGTFSSPGAPRPTPRVPSPHATDSLNGALAAALVAEKGAAPIDALDREPPLTVGAGLACSSIQFD